MDDREPHTWTANQVVAHNLAKARRLRELTQEQAAEKLEPYVGARWSKATFSAAERSVGGDRVREFTADEILAFARAFDLPLGWFFLPPGDQEGEYQPAITSGGSKATSPAELIDVVLPSRDRALDLATRASLFFRRLPKKARTRAQSQLFDHLGLQADAIVVARLDDLGRHARELRKVADVLDGANQMARAKAPRSNGEETNDG